MFSDLSDFLNEPSELVEEFIAIADSNVDGSFLVHHFLSLFLRQQRNIYFVGLQQSFSHYNSVSLKLGLNLNKVKEIGQLIFIEALRSIGDSIVLGTTENPENTCNSTNKWVESLVHNSSLKELFLYLKSVSREHSSVVIIDDITVLLSLGIPLPELIKFIHYLKTTFVCNDGGNVVLFTSGNDKVEDEDQELLWRTMCHHSTIQLFVAGLPSGYCRDVHGEISLIKRKIFNSDEKKIKKAVTATKIQFRTTDKNVVCFAVGTSSAVL